MAPTFLFNYHKVQIYVVFIVFKSFYSSLAVVLCNAKYRIIEYSLGHTGTKSDSSVVLSYLFRLNQVQCTNGSIICRLIIMLLVTVASP